MGFALSAFLAARPLLFHLTARRNVERIKRTGCLYSAASLLAASGDGALLGTKRTSCREVVIDGEVVNIRDQAPLYNGNITFEGGWTFSDLVRDLNRRIFFWPGTGSGPIGYGVRHFERYEGDRPILIRVMTADLLATNPGHVPLFCKYNSGSPRCSGGRGSARGPSTFATASDAAFTPSKVIEVTFLDSITLPTKVEVGKSPVGPWRRLL
jgi:Family of unknown function (DUF7002)